MMENLLDASNFHRQTAVMTRLIEMIIQNSVFGIFCIISMLPRHCFADNRSKNNIYQDQASRGTNAGANFIQIDILC